MARQHKRTLRITSKTGTTSRLSKEPKVTLEAAASLLLKKLFISQEKPLQMVQVQLYTEQDLAVEMLRDQSCRVKAIFG